MYISEIDFTANKTQIPNYAQIGFYLYFKDSDKYGRVVFGDDNRGDNHFDGVIAEQKGFPLTSTQTYIAPSSNTPTKFDPNTFHHLKVVHLNKNIHINYDNCLALTTEFKDENPPVNSDSMYTPPPATSTTSTSAPPLASAPSTHLALTESQMVKPFSA